MINILLTNQMGQPKLDQTLDVRVDPRARLF